MCHITKYRKYRFEVIWRSGSTFLTSNTWLYYLQNPNTYKKTKNYIFPICHIENIDLRSFEGQGKLFWPRTYDYIIYRIQIYKTNKELYFSCLSYWKYRFEVIWRSGSKFLTSVALFFNIQEPNISNPKRIIFFLSVILTNIDLRSFEGQGQSFWPLSNDFFIYRNQIYPTQK